MNQGTVSYLIDVLAFILYRSGTRFAQSPTTCSSSWIFPFSQTSRMRKLVAMVTSLRQEKVKFMYTFEICYNLAVFFL